MLEVELTTRNGTAICLPKGDLDAMTVSTFRGAVGLCLGEPGLIIDLSGVHFIDGAGLTALVGAVSRAREQRTRVAVIVPAGSVQKVLEDAGLDMIVNVSETLDLALAEIQDDAATAKRTPSSPAPSSHSLCRS
jgi:anti-anti-sigma factor